jgi:hypothetical protein
MKWILRSFGNHWTFVLALLSLSATSALVYKLYPLAMAEIQILQIDLGLGSEPLSFFANPDGLERPDGLGRTTLRWDEGNLYGMTLLLPGQQNQLARWILEEEAVQWTLIPIGSQWVWIRGAQSAHPENASEDLSAPVLDRQRRFALLGGLFCALLFLITAYACWSTWYHRPTKTKISI